jgi:hypothetical protein
VGMVGEHGRELSWSRLYTHIRSRGLFLGRASQFRLAFLLGRWSRLAALYEDRRGTVGL